MSLEHNLLSPALLTMMVGVVVGWTREGWGGLLVLGGLAAVAIVNHGIRLSGVFGSMLVVGLLQRICWWRGRANRGAAP